MPATDGAPTKLNLGCGWDHRDGYLNVDFQDVHEPDLVADVRDLSMLESGAYTEIVAQDVLEHLERTDTPTALTEWARLLEVGGKLILRVPDVIGVARLLSAMPYVETHQVLLQNLFGTQAYTGDYHHAGFTELSLRWALHEAGFVVEELVRVDDWMMDAVAVKVDSIGAFEPGDLPYLSLANARPQGAGAEPTPLDKVAATVSGALPGSIRDRARAAWHPARRKLVERGVL